MQIDRDETGQPTNIRMLKPTDLHQHLRDNDMLHIVAPMVGKRFRTALVMPNLDPPITTIHQIIEYRRRIHKAMSRTFFPLMTLYLTDMLDPGEVRSMLQDRLGIGIKYYPPGLTTGSEKGVKEPSSLWTRGTTPHECLRMLADNNGVFLIHAADGITPAPWNGPDRIYGQGEELDPYDQEKHFIKETLPRIKDAHPDLKISVEHLSTADGAGEIRYWAKDPSAKIGCSLTAQHLLLNRLDSFKSGKRMGFNPHRFWWPVIQPREHQQELRRLASEDHPFVWLGSDSAPHPQEKKEADCCTGGVLMAHAGIELYAEAFEDMGALDDRFERFASINGRTFYDIDGFFRLSPSNETIDLVREEWTVKNVFRVEESGYDKPVVPFRLGETIRWKLAE